MATTKAQQKAVDKYVKANYDRIEFKAPKGRKAEIKAHAEAYGESVNSFIGRAIKETMERDRSINGLNAPAAPPAEANLIKQQAAEPEQTAAHLTELEPDKHCKPFTKEVENNVNLVKLLADARYQAEIGVAYGVETLAKLLDKARQQESEREDAAEENTTPMSDLNNSDI